MWKHCFAILFVCVLAHKACAQVVINEIMAANTASHADPQGEYDDWIELYNPTDQPVNMAGHYLTDDLSSPKGWRFPQNNPELTTIASRGYLLIWADDDIGDAGLHADFKLKAGGEVLGLFDADGATEIDAIHFSAQRDDISYGRYPDGSSIWQLLDTPTPGSTNRRQAEGFVATPQISVTSRLFVEPFQVSITCATEGATIYYTLDGSDPHGKRVRPDRRHYTNRYQGPLTISKGTTLRTVALKDGWEPSVVVAERYVYMHADVGDFQSNLPILLVESLQQGIGFEQGPAVCFLFEANEGRARISLSPDVSTLAGIDIRGQSSTSFPKKQYHLEIWDRDSRDRDMALLGLPADSDWVLNGPYSDKSLMRNVLSYQWARDMGHYAPRTRFIEMFIGRQTDALRMSDYVGVYCLTEKIKISPSRVDIAKLSRGEVNEPDITGGYIIKKDKDPRYEDLHFVTDSGQNLIYADPKGHELAEAQQDWVRNYFNQFEAALYSPYFSDPKIGYAAFIDIDSWVDLHLLVEMTKNIDGYRLSNYITKDRQGKLIAGPAWDYNLSLGNANYLDGWDPQGWYFNPNNPGSHPWWPRLFQDPAFQLRYADRWFAFRRGIFRTEHLLDTIDSYVDLLAEAQQRNYQRWPTLGQYVWPNWFIANSYQEEIDWMKSWLTARVAWMDQAIADEYAPAPVTFSRQGGQVDSGYLLHLDANADRIYYTLDGSDPYHPDAGTFSLVAEDAGKHVWIPTGPVPEAWKGGQDFSQRGWIYHEGTPGGVGYEQGSGYEPYIGLDLTERMAGRATGCYIRIPFSLEESLLDLDFVTLNMRYDDGFVAYLNGHEIARANVDHTPTWESEADAQNSDSRAVLWQTFPITDLTLLRPGTNLLAIHGLNRSVSSSDFLIAATLTAARMQDRVVDINTFTYTDPIPLYEHTHIKARSWSGGRWSALNEAIFSVSPVEESLRFTEFVFRSLHLNTGVIETKGKGYCE